MGTGSINVSKWADQSKKFRAKQEKGEKLFVQSKLKTSLNPLDKVRESLKSDEHPNPTSIIVCFDVTGSMGKIPKYFVTNTLTKVFERLSSGSITGLEDPQLMFMAVGDARCDAAPLQVGQFESSNASADDLLNIYLESGGGGNHGESYNLAWYYASKCCVLDSWQENKKGILITIGDENVHPHLDEDEIRTFIDTAYQGEQRVRNASLLNSAQGKWDTNHVVITETSTYQRQSQYAKTVLENWQELLGQQHVFRVDDYRNVADAIADRVLVQAIQRLDMEPKIAKKSQQSDYPRQQGLFSKGGDGDQQQEQVQKSFEPH